MAAKETARARPRGMACKHCGAIGQNRVLRTYADRRRKRLCTSCGKTFLSREV